VAKEMESAGVAGISILTEPSVFGGSRRMLLEASRQTRVPILRKDFLVDVRELEESRALGADAVLLIVRLLGEGLESMYDESLGLGLTPLVEVHDEAEMEAASRLDPELIGINNRNLDDFTIDLGNTARLASLAPARSLVVSESGYSCREEILRMSPFCHAFLVGSALMAGKPGEKILELQGRGA
jgi:indole-3-glycerol phosphate synthase